jgi:hypothetical protein
MSARARRGDGVADLCYFKVTAALSMLFYLIEIFQWYFLETRSFTVV